MTKALGIQPSNTPNKGNAFVFSVFFFTKFLFLRLKYYTKYQHILSAASRKS
ncbi:MAG: hypothetical protein ACJASU_001846 [Cognaticolwellia sp.]|jgi:hypothetical protein